MIIVGFVIVFILGGLFGVVMTCIVAAAAIKKLDADMKTAEKRAQFYEWKWSELVETTGRRIAESKK